MSDLFACCKCKKHFEICKMVTQHGKSKGICRKCNNKIGLLNSKLRLGRMSFNERLNAYNNNFYKKESVFLDYGTHEFLVSRCGSIYLINGGVSGKIFTEPRILPISDCNGYKKISLRKNHKVTQEYVHRLVATAFYGESNLTVNHKNGNKSDNRIENLEFISIEENIRHAIYKLRKPKGVYLDKKSNMFYTRIGIYGKHKNLGYYKTKEEAQNAYDREYAKLL